MYRHLYPLVDRRHLRLQMSLNLRMMCHHLHRLLVDLAPIVDRQLLNLRHSWIHQRPHLRDDPLYHPIDPFHLR